MPPRPVYASVPLRSIRLTDTFWLGRQRTIRDVTLRHMWLQMETTGRLENFRRVASGGGAHASKYCFDDSDLYKWLEAAAYALLLGPSDEVQQMVDEAIGLVTDAQQADGYVDTFIQLNHPGLKFRNLISMHEMYCAGHMIEAAVALHECADDDRLLDIATRFANLLVDTFGPGKRLGYAGHEEIELALLRLTKATGNPKYEQLATWFVQSRGSRPSPFEAEIEDAETMTLSPYARRMHFRDGKYVGEYCQDHAPVAEHTEVVGHAVRAMYLYIAATEVAARQDDETLAAAMVRAWANLTGRRMYITGGIGPSGENEGFTADYDLPNATAYAETCAACGLVFWGQKLAAATGNAEYVEVVERALYNGALAGISLSGDQFFYANPLDSRGRDRRTPWFECACCPPNIARLIGSVAAYAIGHSADSIYVNLPIALEADLEFHGVKTTVRIESDYPWSGRVQITVDPATPVEFDLRVRIPEWADEVHSELPGLAREATYQDGYAVYTKRWSSGDSLQLDFGMSARWMEADPKVRDDLGRVAMVRGPLVYCAESHDSGWAPHLFMADTHEELEVEKTDEFGGAMRITAVGSRCKEDPSAELYVEITDAEPEPAQLSMLPYFLWANRGPCDMLVWLQRE